MRAQAVHDRLSAHSYRNTRTRDAVIGFLAEQRYLVTVEQISEAVRVDPVTVYRVLDVLEQLGIVHKIQSDASYITIPQSLWDEQSRAILIDSTVQKIYIRPYQSPRDDIVLTKTVVELRGSIGQRAETGEKQETGEKTSVTLSEVEGSSSSKDDDVSNDVMYSAGQKEEDIESVDDMPGDDEISATIVFDSDYIDRLHRF